MSTAEKATANLYSMAYHSALAMLTNRGNGLNRTLKAVERVACARSDQLESLIVFITANFAFRHGFTSVSHTTSKPPHSQPWFSLLVLTSHGTGFSFGTKAATGYP
jgi:hypothetical protein